MKLIAGSFAALALALALAAAPVGAQGNADAVKRHVAAAKAAAGIDHTELYTTLCGEFENGIPPPPDTPPPAAPAGAPAGARPRRPAPDRSQWHADPVKVFDNLYFVGQSEYSAWAVTTTQGIIVIDALYDYSVQDEVVGGLKTLGLDPSTIKYVVISHGHGDHSGGAKYLQDTFKARVLLSAPDWDLLDKSNGTKPTRDMTVTEGQKLTLGDETLTFHMTPGHTLGTISTLVPVKDNGRPHLMAAWGGTAFNFQRTPERYKMYIASAERFGGIVRAARADGIIANHTRFDGSKTKLPAIKTRAPGASHPYVIGADAAGRYLDVARECALAGLAAIDTTTK